MEWKFIIHDGNKYLEVTTTGIADEKGSLDMAKAIATYMRSNRIRKVLIDHRLIEGVSGKITEIYKRPQLFALIGWALGIKIAEIINTQHIEHFRFFETVCFNQGYKLQIFQDKENALIWLLE